MPGEIVLVSNGSELVSSLVRSVSLVERTGMIAPVTIQGNLIVNEVLSSCYAKIMDHDVAHMAFAPLKLAHTCAVKGIYSARNALVSTNTDQN